MEMLVFNLLLLIFHLPMNKISFVHGDTRDLDILKRMKSWGKSVQNSYLPKNMNTVKQYIAVAILSNKILQDSNNINLETGCPNRLVSIHTYQCRTSAVILNENLMENDPRLANIRNAEDFQNRMKDSGSDKNPPSGWHGEIILLHGGVLETLISNFWHDVGGDETVRCQVYLYSYYIPCALIKNTPYSCSREIMLYNEHTTNDNRQCRITVVGYTAIYNFYKHSKTDVEIAQQWISDGSVELYEFNKMGHVYYIPSKEVNNMDRQARRNRRNSRASNDLNLNTDDMILQALMYECLNNTPLPFCCLSDPTDTVRQEKILSFFVNAMSYSCTHNSTEIGSLFTHSLPDLKRCFSSWLQDNIGSDCRICSDGSLQSAWYQQYLIAFCIDGIMDWATTFGRPSNGWDLTNPAWVPWNGPWNKMYLESIHSFQRRENLFCENRMLDIGSMCTKVTTKTIRKQSIKNLLIDKYLWP